MIHIDWLTVSELHPEGCPEFGEIEVMRFEAETGEMVSRSLTGQVVEGSFVATLRVRSMGGRVEISGNPSKWGRMDAVAGVQTMEEAQSIYNDVLLKLGLPPFSFENPRLMLPTGEIQKWGPKVSRIDLTRNIVTGGPEQAQRYLNFCSSHKWGRLDPYWKGKASLAWGKKGRRLLRMYSKADEIRSHMTEIMRKIDPFNKERCRDYLGKLAEWAETNGLVREEIELGRRLLNESEWTAISSWYCIDLSDRFPETVREQASGGATVIDWKTEVFDRVLSSTGSERQARVARDMLLAWMAGAEPSEGMSVRTFQRYAKLLRENCAVDVRRPCNIQAISTRVRVVEVEARVLQESDLPEWYLRAVA